MDDFQLLNCIFDKKAIGSSQLFFVQYCVDLILQIKHFLKCLPGTYDLSEPLGYIGAWAGKRWQWLGFFYPHNRKGEYAWKQYRRQHEGKYLRWVSGADEFPKSRQAEKVPSELFSELV